MYRRLLRNGALVRALLSFGAAYTAEWAFTVAISLVAYANGGAVAVGLVGLLRLVPAALLAPAVSTYADRLPREKVLFVSSAVRGLATVLTAPILIAGGPIWIVYALAIVSTIAFTPYRASHSALMPLLCRAPEELTSINVVRGLLDSFSVVVGPFVAAVLVSVSDVASVFVFAGVCGILSAVLVLGLKYERLPAPREQAADPAREIREGMRALSENDGVWLVFFFVILQTVIRGAFTVFVVVVAIDLLGRGESEVGRAPGCGGHRRAGGQRGLHVARGQPGHDALAGVAVVLWGVPLAVIGVVPEYAVALGGRCRGRRGQRDGRRHRVHTRGTDGARRRACTGLRAAGEPGGPRRRTGLAASPRCSW